MHVYALDTDIAAQQSNTVTFLCMPCMGHKEADGNAQVECPQLDSLSILKGFSNQFEPNMLLCVAYCQRLQHSLIIHWTSACKRGS